MNLQSIINALIDFSEETTTPESSYSDEIVKLFSHKGYDELMNGDLNDSKLVSMFIEGATPCLQIFDMSTDEQLRSLTPEMKEKVLHYLNRLKEIYIRAVDNVILRLTTPKEKSLNEMSREELIDYIKNRIQQ